MFEIGTTTKYHHIIHTSNTTWFNIIQTMWICFKLRQNWIPLPWPCSLDTLFSATKRLSIISFTINHWSSLSHLSCYFTSYRWSCWLTDWRLQHGFEMKCGLVLKFIPFSRLPLELTFHSWSWLTFARYLISFRSLNGQQMEYPTVQEVHVLSEE